MKTFQQKLYKICKSGHANDNFSSTNFYIASSSGHYISYRKYNSTSGFMKLKQYTSASRSGNYSTFSSRGR